MEKRSYYKVIKISFLVALAGIIGYLLFVQFIPRVNAQKDVEEENNLSAINSYAALPCSVIGFSQHDAIFQSELYTASCLGSGNETMSSGGCAITSLAMMLKYYGVNTTPRLLDDKLGVDGCPLSSHWGDLPLVDGPTSSVSYVGAQDGTLSGLSTTIAGDLAAGHPVVLHMALSSGVNHYVLVISGSGTSASNYQIVDSSDGIQKSLQAKYDQGYSVKGIIRYAGTPACQNNLQVPVNVSATDNLSDKVAITWDAVPNATSYEVWRYTSNVWQAAKRLSKGIVNLSYNDTTGQLDKIYAYWVAACNSNGCTTFSNRNYGTRVTPTPPTLHQVYLPVIVNGSLSEPPFTQLFYIQPTLNPAYTGNLCTVGWLRINGWQSNYSYLTLNTNLSDESGYTATYSLTVEKTGTYRISNWVADHSPIEWSCPTKVINSDSSFTPFRVNHAGGQTVIYIDQLPIADNWATLGTFTFNAGVVYKIIIFDLNSEDDWSKTISAGTLRAQYMP